MKKETFLLNTDIYELMSINVDHIKPVLTINDEPYIWRPSEIIEIPSKSLFGKKQIKKYPSGYRTDSYEYINPYIYEKYTVINNIVYYAYCVNVTYREKGQSKKVKEYNFYAQTEEKMQEIVDNFKQHCEFTELSNISDKVYKI